MPRKLAKWKQEFLDSLSSIGNEELIELALSSQVPDQYGEYFSDRGAFESQAYENELRRRLIDTGFLKKPEGKT